VRVGYVVQNSDIVVQFPNSDIVFPNSHVFSWFRVLGGVRVRYVVHSLIQYFLL